jgi:nicotinamidase-related amidase
MLTENNTALVVVDVQGKLAELMHDKDQLWGNLQKLVKGARALQLPVLWNEQLPEKLGPTIAPLRELLHDLRPMPKNTFSCCGNDEFLRALEATGRKQVLLAGIEAHVCVYQTALDLASRGYEVQVVADAVSSRTRENKEVALGRMKDAGARLTTTEMALFEMLGKAEGPAFSEIIKIVK